MNIIVNPGLQCFLCYGGQGRNVFSVGLLPDLVRAPGSRTVCQFYLIFHLHEDPSSAY